jgi:hypothetical protein
LRSAARGTAAAIPFGMLSNTTKGITNMKAISKPGIMVRAGVKAGGWTINHNRGLRVKTTVKAGGWTINHNRGLRVKTAVKAGGWTINHNRGLHVKTAVRAGMKFSGNHNSRALQLN